VTYPGLLQFNDQNDSTFRNNYRQCGQPCGQQLKSMLDNIKQLYSLNDKIKNKQVMKMIIILKSD